ncbi:hypothetical protein PAPYR_8679 [Paratrimastix pyriformis]|uniref:Uncharacterized protein n=1 Tax=Paratrimastix pyriformis TaxID=342808 RepID=A0ABQ8UFI6_9EUKA|nr:hypothetical protein PAPYR_8679 [Paratrimastix pyriformis]
MQGMSEQRTIASGKRPIQPSGPSSREWFAQQGAAADGGFMTTSSQSFQPSSPSQRVQPSQRVRDNKIFSTEPAGQPEKINRRMAVQDRDDYSRFGAGSSDSAFVTTSRSSFAGPAPKAPAPEQTSSQASFNPITGGTERASAPRGGQRFTEPQKGPRESYNILTNEKQ